MKRSTTAGRSLAAAALGVLAATAILATDPGSVAGSCADFLAFEEVARQPGVAVFTGRAIREDAEYRVVFAVDRWFSGAHPARAVRFSDATTELVEPAAGAIPAVLARVTAGDAIGLVRDEPVIVTAVRSSTGDYDPVSCSPGAVPLESPEGRAALDAATAMFGRGIPSSQLPATATLIDAARATGPSAAWLPLAAFLAALAGALLVLGRRRTAAADRPCMRRLDAGALLVAGVLLAGGCGQATTPRSNAPASMPPATEGATPTATLRPTSSPVTASPASASETVFTVDCGALATCLQVAAAAELALDVDRPPYTRVAVFPLEPFWTPPPTPSPTPGPPASLAVEVETFVVGYRVDFSWPSESQVITVFQGSEGWIAGLPPAATRFYRFAGEAGTWTESVPFALQSAEYGLDGTCAGDGSSPGGAAVVLERVDEGGSVLAEAVRLGCGPTTTFEVFVETLRLDAGLYRLAVEDATGGLEVHLGPVTAE